MIINAHQFNYQLDHKSITKRTNVRAEIWTGVLHDWKRALYQQSYQPLIVIYSSFLFSFLIPPHCFSLLLRVFRSLSLCFCFSHAQVFSYFRRKISYDIYPKNINLILLVVVYHSDWQLVLLWFSWETFKSSCHNKAINTMWSWN